MHLLILLILLLLPSRASQRDQPRAPAMRKRKRERERKRARTGGTGDLERTRSPFTLLPGLGRYLSTVRRSRAHFVLSPASTQSHVCTFTCTCVRAYLYTYTCIHTYMRARETRTRRTWRDGRVSHGGDPVRYTPHNVVQTPWARRTAFQDGCVDVAHDGVRDGGGRRKTKRKMKKREKKKASRSGG